MVSNLSFDADNPAHRNYLYRLSYLNNDTLPVELDSISDKYSWEYWCQRNFLSYIDVTGGTNLHYGIRLGVTAVAIAASFYLASTALSILGIANPILYVSASVCYTVKLLVLEEAIFNYCSNVSLLQRN